MSMRIKDLVWLDSHEEQITDWGKVKWAQASCALGTYIINASTTVRCELFLAGSVSTIVENDIPYQDGFKLLKEKADADHRYRIMLSLEWKD